MYVNARRCSYSRDARVIPGVRKLCAGNVQSRCQAISPKVLQTGRCYINSVYPWSSSAPTWIVILAVGSASLGCREEASKMSVPRYQKTVPRSCGPWLITHATVTELPAFTCKSLGPKIRARASENKTSKHLSASRGSSCSAEIASHNTADRVAC